MKNLLLNAETSVVKAVVDLAKQLSDEGLSKGIEYVELDARVELRDVELPEGDLMGVTQFSISEVQPKLWNIHFLIGVSTVADTNLFRLRALANAIYDRFPCGAQMIYYDAETAAEQSWIQVIPGTVQLPTHRVETRPFRFIQVFAVLDPLQGSRQEQPDLVP